MENIFQPKKSKRNVTILQWQSTEPDIQSSGIHGVYRYENEAVHELVSITDNLTYHGTWILEKDKRTKKSATLHDRYHRRYLHLNLITYPLL